MVALWKSLLCVVSFVCCWLLCHVESWSQSRSEYSALSVGGFNVTRCLGENVAWGEIGG